MVEFSFVTCRIVGSSENMQCIYYPNEEMYPSYSEAEKAGWDMYASDDFFIAEYTDGKCIATYLHDDDGKEVRLTDCEGIEEVNKALQGRE